MRDPFDPRGPGPFAEDRTEVNFEPYKPAYTADQAVTEANRCLYCYDAPCMTACPTHIDVAGFIRKIATGNVKGAARTILDANIFGMSCARVCPVEVLCVGSCVYNEKGVPPIQIGRLQQYATDPALEHDWQFFAAAPDTGYSVGLLGGGPASLACAHELRRLGHRVTIYEKKAVLGGLNTAGVAPYKILADDAYSEVEYVLGIGGIEVQTNVEVGRDVTLAELEQRHDAVFIGLGLGPDSRMPVPGADLPGVVGAVEWIERMKLGKVDLAAVRSAAVIGGGNTAIDVVRELLGLGVPSVSLVYRGTEDGMSGYEHEWDSAKIEGARAVWRAQPLAFSGAGKVESVVCAVMDEDKRPIPGQTVEVAADLVLLAIGQAKLGALVAGLDGVVVEKGRIVTGEGGATGRAGWYAGGDCANGGKEVVNAAAEGKAAARAMDAYFRGRMPRSPDSPAQA